MTRTWLAVLAGLAVAGPAPALQAAHVDLIKINGAIGPATAGNIARTVDQASARNAECVIIQLDTPGGLLDSTKEIVQTLYAAKIPVVIYVAPQGANAGSAGCFITLAGDIAAMAPNTSIGAAHPVSLGGAGEEKLDDVMKQKLENYAASYIETIAAKRQRNVEWAKSAVRESASITAEKALELKVIEIIAADLPDLLRQLDGRKVNGRVLATARAELAEQPMIAREKVFQLLWRPEVMFVLMLVAIYGLIGELSNPGAILPGVVGAIALILTLYMGAILPVNIAGVALVVLAVGLFLIDAFAPTHGVLTAGGVIAFFLGALMMFDSSLPSFRLSWPVIVPATLITAAFFTLVVAAGLRAQFRPVRTGREKMPGGTATALTPIGPESGKVLFEGEYWTAVSDAPIGEGRPVEVVSVQGLTLKVKPKT